MIDGDLLTARVHFFRTLGDRTRIEILELLSNCQEMTVSEISEKLAKEHNLISHHLGCLKNAGIVKAKRGGKNVIYSMMNRETVKLFRFADDHILSVLDNILSCKYVKD
jgi:DNA-binding transcriptional ArsR family regulator